MRIMKVAEGTKYRGQALVEFALALPILLLLLVGILEVGRMLFIYSAVNNASREAARYGSAVGLNDAGTSPKYQDCAGIRDTAKRSAYFMDLADSEIVISYDHGPGSGSPFDVCPVGTSEDPTINVNTLAEPDRIVVTVTSTYSPMLSLIPLSSRPVSSSSARTIFGILDMTTGNSVVPTTTPTKTPGAADPPTDVPSDTPTEKPTDLSQTFTATEPGGDVFTLTPFETWTPTLTPTETLTPTLTLTPTMTYTPTSTSTPVPGCSNITAGPITIGGDLYGPKSMSMTITNPHNTIAVSDVQVTWNSSTGAPGNNTLTLTSVTLGTTTFWIGSSTAGSGLTIPATSVTIPGNNITSTMIFTFNRNYQNPSGNSITINLSTVGCESYPIQRP